MSARSQAYDDLFVAGNGVIDDDLFKAKQREIYASRHGDKDGDARLMMLHLGHHKK